MYNFAGFSCFSRSSKLSIMNCIEFSLLYGLFFTCLGSKMKQGITLSFSFNAAISPVLSSNLRSLLNMNTAFFMVLF